jgi:lysozyme
MTERCIELIKRFEGCRLEAYRCPAGVLTIGYGHTRNVKQGQRITQEDADRLLREDAAKIESGVRAALGSVRLADCKIDALVSFAFNVGIGAFGTSTLARKVKVNPDDTSIRSEFLRWVFAGGKRLQGLVRRREEEAKMYFAGFS